jgi:hypothetical protein
MSRLDFPRPQYEPDDFVQPGGTYTEKLDEAGTKKFQCCIHPWMHLTATVK